MTITKVPQKTITQVIDAMQWVVSGDDAEAAAETRKRALAQARCRRIPSLRGENRQISRPSQVGGFFSSETRSTGAFRKPEGTDGAGAREEA
jgi:hypothetical protein